MIAGFFEHLYGSELLPLQTLSPSLKKSVTWPLCPEKPFATCCVAGTNRHLPRCGRGGIGRRAALRSLWGNPWKFESSRPHHSLSRGARKAGYHLAFNDAAVFARFISFRE